MIDRLRALRDAPLRRLLLAFALLNLSEWGLVTAFSIYAFRSGGTEDVGLIGLRLLAGAVSSAVLAPLISGRRGALSEIALARTLLLGAAAVMVITGVGYTAALIFVVLDSIPAAGYRPSQSRLMPSLASSPTELTHAVAGESMAKTLGQASGALIGGIVVDFVATGTAMAALASVMILSLICGAALGGSAMADNDDNRNSLRIGLSAFPAVFRHVHSWPLVSAGVLRTLLRGLWGALLVVVALKMLHTSNSGVGVLQAASGVGAVIALPLIASQVGRSRLAPPCLAAFIVAGIAIAAVGGMSALAPIVVFICLWGIAMAVADATAMSLLHRVLNADELTATVGVMESLKLVSEGAGALLAPALVALFGLRAALVIAGLPLPLLMVGSSTRILRSDLEAAGRGLLVRLLHSVKVFRGLHMASIERLAAHTQEMHVAAGVEVIRQGDHGDHFYVVESGEAQVTIDGFDIRLVGPGGEFGERALLRNTPRTATVTAVTDMKLYVIERDDFLEAVTGLAGATLERQDTQAQPLPEMLAELPTFAHVGAAEIDDLAELASHEHFAQGAVMFREGDPSDTVYVIISGRVQLEQGGLITSVIEPGDSLGELGVLRGHSRTRTATAIEPLTVATLPASAVLATVGSEAGADPGHRIDSVSSDPPAAGAPS